MTLKLLLTRARIEVKRIQTPLIKSIEKLNFYLYCVLMKTENVSDIVANSVRQIPEATSSVKRSKKSLKTA